MLKEMSHINLSIFSEENEQIFKRIKNKNKNISWQLKLHWGILWESSLIMANPKHWLEWGYTRGSLGTALDLPNGVFVEELENLLL